MISNFTIDHFCVVQISLWSIHFGRRSRLVGTQKLGYPNGRVEMDVQHVHLQARAGSVMMIWIIHFVKLVEIVNLVKSYIHLTLIEIYSEHISLKEKSITISTNSKKWTIQIIKANPTQAHSCDLLNRHMFSCTLFSKATLTYLMRSLLFFSFFLLKKIFRTHVNMCLDDKFVGLIYRLGKKTLVIQ